MSTFVENTRKSDRLADYPYIALRLPRGKAIIKPNGVRKEGWSEGVVQAIQATPTMADMFTELCEQRGYFYVEDNLEPSHPLYGLAKSLEAKENARAKMYGAQKPAKGTKNE